MIEIAIDRDSEKPLYAQIRDALQALINHKQLKPGDQLPTVVSLASQAGVTQCTIRRAYEDLTKAGILVSQVGRGTFVCELEPGADKKENGRTPDKKQSPTVSSDPEGRNEARRLRSNVSTVLENLLAFKHRPGLIKFLKGVPVPETLRAGLLKDMLLDALKEGEEKYAFTGDPMGLPELRREVVERQKASGLDITPDQVLITTGSQQSFGLVAQAMRQEGRRIICEIPCYTGIPIAFNAVGHWVDGLARDQEGPVPDGLNRFWDNQPSLLYLCPLLHNPMGVDIAPDRRNTVLRWARHQGAVVISDDIFRGLHYDGSLPPHVVVDPQSLDQTMIAGSVSKVLAGGLRVGWLISSRERVRALANLKKSLDQSTAPLMQGLVLSLFRSGEFDRHLETVREYYRVRTEAVLSALKRYMPAGVTWTVPAGGFNMWVELPAGYSSLVLFLLAVEKGVAFIPGPYMDIDHRFLNAFRLCYSDLSLEQIDEGIRLLGEAVGDLLDETPRELGLTGLGDFL